MGLFHVKHFLFISRETFATGIFSILFIIIILYIVFLKKRTTIFKIMFHVKHFCDILHLD